MEDQHLPARRTEAKRKSDKARSKTRVNLGLAFGPFRALKEKLGLRSDFELCCLLLDCFEKQSKEPCLSFHTSVTRNAQPPPPPSSNGTEPQSNLRTSSKNRPEPLKFQRRESTDTCDSMDCESPWSSSNEDNQETCAASSANRKAPGKQVAAPQKAGSQDRRLTIKLSQNEVNRDIEEDEHEEISTTLTVEDGRYLVDLGSSSEFIVDEECILQMFKSCQECNKQCSVRKRVQGLKIVVNQACYFCESRFTWTNLPDADEDDGGDQINGQTNTATSPSSNTS